MRKSTKSAMARLGIGVALVALLLAFTLLIKQVGRADEPLPFDTTPLTLSEQDRADLERISDYLTRVKTMKGRFLQVTSEGGSAEGEFYVLKPGRMRFDYDPPIPIVFLADGTWVKIEDADLETVNSYPLSETPLKYLVADQIDLARDAKITKIERLMGQIRVTAVEDEGYAQGSLTMIFSDPGLELRQWVMVDAQGVRTTIALREVQEGLDLDPGLFVARDFDFESND